MVQLGEAEPGQVRGLIAGTLGDPTLQLGLWYEEDQTWVDEQGRELQLPSSRGVTFLGRDLAVLVHDPRLLDKDLSARRASRPDQRCQSGSLAF